ncbi:MAG: hypothetical protein ACJ8AW_07955 [Rhodopila sp.]
MRQRNAERDLQAYQKEISAGSGGRLGRIPDEASRYDHDAGWSRVRRDHLTLRVQVNVSVPSAPTRKMIRRRSDS